MSSFMPRWQECQEDFPGVLVQKMILHRRVAQAPVCTLPLLDIPCPCVVPIIRLLRTTLTNPRLDRDKKWYHCTRGL